MSVTWVDIANKRGPSGGHLLRGIIMEKFDIKLFLRLSGQMYIFLAAFAACKISIGLDNLSAVVYSLLLTGVIALVSAAFDTVNYIKLVRHSGHQQKDKEV